MRIVKLPAAVVVTAVLVSPTQAQMAQPGPEHAQLKKMEGTWDAAMNMGGQEMKGVAVYKMDLGGLWLTNTYESEMGGVKFKGKGYDTYDAGKKKYISVWLDSMSTSPMVLEGTFDEKTKTMTMSGDGPGMDGKMVKHRTTTTMKDDNTMEFAMFTGDAKEPMFTITYKRRK